MRSLWSRTRLGFVGRVSQRFGSHRRGSGRILAVKWGLNPNSSSLGVDVTFLLFGAAALSLATPVVAALLRWRKPALNVPAVNLAAQNLMDLPDVPGEDRAAGQAADGAAGGQA
jgi:hypothetical protein